MKVCDHCKKNIQGMDYIQVTFLGRLQQLPLTFRRGVQLEFCSFTCFQEFFKFLVKEVDDANLSGRTQP